MLIYLLFFYLFRNTPSTAVDASPILNLTSNSTSSFADSFITLATRQSDSSMAGTCNCNQRSTLDIVWSCIATLFLCTWSSIHPNMPAPKDEWWRILWRRLKSMYWALIAPELVLTWAVRQWIGVGNILEKYGEIPDQPTWTKKHAQFLQMGGFHLRKPEGVKSTVLEPEKFFELLEEKKISVRFIEERDIEDKSKADALTKIVVIFQTLWFVIQCIGRHAQGLALAQLEVATLAVISCTFILCVIWWDKPFDAQQPIYLDLLSQPDSPPTVPSDGKNTFRGEDGISDLSIANQLVEPESKYTPRVGKQTKLQKVIQKIITSAKSIYVTILTIIRTVYKEVTSEDIESELLSSWPRIAHICIGWPIVDPLTNLIAGDDSNQERVGSYNSYSETTVKILFLPALSAALFRLVHCISWESEFPSATERVLWRISAVGVGSLLAVSGLLAKIDHETSNNYLKGLAGFGILIVFPAYILARYYLLIEALLSLRALPPSAFQTIEWSDFLPHM